MASRRSILTSEKRNESNFYLIKIVVFVFSRYVSSSIFNLETELIIYRHLLGDVNVKQRVTTVKHPTTSEISDRFVIENKTRRRGSIGISNHSNTLIFFS